MKIKAKNELKRGSASVEVIMSVAVFMVLMLIAFWITAQVYSTIYGINAVSSGAGLSTIITLH